MYSTKQEMFQICISKYFCGLKMINLLYIVLDDLFFILSTFINIYIYIFLSSKNVGHDILESMPSYGIQVPCS